MVKIIAGAMGTGKTNELLSKANEQCKEEKGVCVYLDNSDKNRMSIDNKIKFVNVKEFAVSSSEIFFGFICGMIAGNYDIDNVYIDNIEKIIGIDCAEAATAFVEQLTDFTKEYGVSIMMTLNVTNDEEADYIKKFAS